MYHAAIDASAADFFLFYGININEDNYDAYAFYTDYFGYDVHGPGPYDYEYSNSLGCDTFTYQCKFDYEGYGGFSDDNKDYYNYYRQYEYDNRVLEEALRQAEHQGQMGEPLWSI